MKVDNAPIWDPKWNTPDPLSGSHTEAPATELIITPKTVELAKRVLRARRQKDAEQRYIDQPSHASKVEFNAARGWFDPDRWYPPKN